MTRRDVAIDVGSALVLAALVGTITAIGLDTYSDVDRTVDSLAVGLVVAATLALALRRARPVLGLVVATVATVAYLLLEYPYGPVMISLLAAVYAVARYRSLAVSAAASAVCLLLLLSHVPVHPAALPGWQALMPAAGWVVVPFALGTTRRLTREADQRTRAQHLHRGVVDERLRIAHEVHDVVGHGLAAIQMTADIGLHVSERDPAHARTALQTISRSSADALQELRSALHVVQRAEDPAAPVAGLARVGDLCERIRGAGVQVGLDIDGQPRPMPAPVDLAAYRVIQEALTNVIRHAAVPLASVAIGYEPHHLRLSITNPGSTTARTTSADDQRLGLRGMRRRVVNLGGDFQAGVTDDGFAVRALIPTGEPS